eukprot:Skav226194  [mRNA]  locus=scaffold2212:155871:156504:- [translate_table: standard]
MTFIMASTEKATYSVTAAPIRGEISLIKGSATSFQSMPPVMHIHSVIAAVPRLEKYRSRAVDSCTC